MDPKEINPDSMHRMCGVQRVVPAGSGYTFLLREARNTENEKSTKGKTMTKIKTKKEN